jgi:peptidoglycan hydrolase-like protein with peptidoglycan-binding domain
MGTEFLRKIILEELQKVLKEQAAVADTRGNVQSLGGPLNIGGRAKPATDTVADIAAGKNLGGLANIINQASETPEQRKAAVLKLQSKLAQVGFLDKKDVIGIFGPKTTAAINAYLGASGSGALNLNDIKKMPLTDINTMVAALNAGNKQDMQKLVAKYRAGMAADPAAKALAAANARDQARQSAQPAEPTAKPSSTGVTAPVQKPTVGTKSFGVRKAEDVKDLGKKKEEEAPNPKLGGLEESIAREVKKLLRNI